MTTKIGDIKDNASLPIHPGHHILNIPDVSFFFFLSPYAASRHRGHSGQVGAVVLKEEGNIDKRIKRG